MVKLGRNNNHAGLSSSDSGGALTATNDSHLHYPVSKAYDFPEARSPDPHLNLAQAAVSKGQRGCRKTKKFAFMQPSQQKKATEAALILQEIKAQGLPSVQKIQTTHKKITP